ncbi:response regulator [Rhizobium sp.]|uniref:response regulator n=1 Tax=Rhizobium sp. TaxID=391 RepID=UPI002897681D
MEILVVEDNEIIGDAVTGRLQADGNSVEWRKSVASALAASELQTFDCVVLDLRLPDGNGFRFLDNLRDRGIRTPVLILTAFDQISDQIAGIAHGADDHLTKPFSLPELSRRVARLGQSRTEPLLSLRRKS